MKDKILTILADYPNGIRLRDLAWQTKTKPLFLWNPLCELIEENKIVELAVNSFETGESFYIFKLVKSL